MILISFGYSLKQMQEAAKCNNELTLADLRIEKFRVDQEVIHPVSKFGLFGIAGNMNTWQLGVGCCK